MKIIMDLLKNAPEEALPADFFESLTNEVPCPNTECSGKIQYILKQTHDGSAVVCNTCQKAIIIKTITV